MLPEPPALLRRVPVDEHRWIRHRRARLRALRHRGRLSRLVRGW